MIIAGPCSFLTLNDINEIYATARALEGVADLFRVKIWLGGTTPDRYATGVEETGLPILQKINDEIIPTGTEVQTPEHIVLCTGLDYIWIGARNSQNYALLKATKTYAGEVFIKRGPGMTIDETIGIFDIMKRLHNKEPYIIERGINTFDRDPSSRWSPDLKGALVLKNSRPDIFKRLVLDCSHSVGLRQYIEDVYKVFKAAEVKHFMFECNANLENCKTDVLQAMSVDEVKKIIGG